MEDEALGAVRLVPSLTAVTDGVGLSATLPVEAVTDFTGGVAAGAADLSLAVTEDFAGATAVDDLAESPDLAAAVSLALVTGGGGG